MAKDEKQKGIRQRGQRALSSEELVDQLSKGMTSALRVQVLTILNEREASPNELSREMRVSIGKMSYAFRVLRDAECIVMTKEIRRRGAVETFYKATSRAFLDASQWPEIPETIRNGLRATLFMNVVDDAVCALDGETYESRADSHMSWIPMITDEQGCVRLAAILERALKEVVDVQEESKERLLAAEEDGISYTVSMLGYPAAGGRRQVGPPADPKELRGKRD